MAAEAGPWALRLTWLEANPRVVPLGRSPPPSLPPSFKFRDGVGGRGEL